MWNIETLVDGAWTKVSPSSFAVRKIQSKPYEFKTEADAREMSKLCHDAAPWTVRVVNTCTHAHGFPYAGKVPCTGPRRCPLCGEVLC